jgi:hypothetical protein
MVGLGVSGIVSEVDRVGEECGELLEDDAVWGEELMALEELEMQVDLGVLRSLLLFFTQ